MEKVEGAAAGYYVAALFESARPGHRGLNMARLAHDARTAGRSRAILARLHLACRTRRRAPLLRHSRILRPATHRARRRSPLRGAAIRGSTKPRIGGAA